MSDRNRSGSGGRRRSAGDGGPDWFAQQLSQVVKEAFQAGAEENVATAPGMETPLLEGTAEHLLEAPVAFLPAPIEPDAVEPTEVEAIPAPPAEPLPARMLNEFVYCPRLFYYEHVEGVFVENADTLRGSAIHARVDGGTGALPAARKKGAASPGATGVAAGPEVVTASGEKAVAGSGAAAEEKAAGQDNTAETIHSRSVSLGSERLGVTAKLDLVEVRPAAASISTAAASPSDAADLLALEVQPVDYKVGAPREGEAGNELWPADRMQLGLQMLLLRDNGYRCSQGIIFYRTTKQRVPLECTPELEAWVLGQIEAARATMRGPIPPPLVDSPKCARCSLVTVCLPDETRLLALNAALPASPPRRLIAARDDRRVLYLNTPGLHVGRSGEVLQVRDKKQVVQEVRASDLCHVALFGNIQISTQVVQTLCENDTPLSYFSMGGWFYGITRGHSLTNVFLRMEQFRQATDPARCLRLARTFVQGKIRNHRTMLMRNHLQCPPAALQRLKVAQQDVESALQLETLLGMEGAAAHTYFQQFGGMIKVAEDAELDPATSLAPGPQQLRFNFDFNGRNRRPPTDPVNALLSLAYSLLAKDCTIACLAVGFDPYIGFYHQPRYGRPALALDLCEEFRPLIAESAVLSAINTRMVTAKDFVSAGRAVSLTPAGRRHFFEAYEKRMTDLVTHPVFDYKVSYRRALELQARILARVLTGEIPEYMPFVTR